MPSLVSLPRKFFEI